MIKRLFKDKKAAVTGLRPFITNIFLIVIFSFFLLSFVTMFLLNTNPSSDVLNSKYGLASTAANLNKTIGSYRLIGDQASAEMGSSSPSATTFLFLIFEGAFKIPKLFLTLVIDTIKLISTSLFGGLGGTGLGIVLAVTLSAIATTLVIALVFLMIKAIRSGESER